MGSLDLYKLANPLGKGTFGEVFLAQHRDRPKERYAVKEICDMKDSGFYDIVGVKESEFYHVMKRYEITGVVRVEECIVHQKEFSTHIVMEACLGGSLDKILLTEEYTKLPLVTRLQMFTQYVTSFRDMHAVGVSHLDIKTENILCRKAGDISDSVICDGSNVVFRLQNIQTVLPRIPFVSPIYRPPEFTVFTDMTQPEKADVWSLGILFLEMFGGDVFILELNEDGEKFVNSVQPELKRFRNLLNSDHKKVSQMQIAPYLNKEKNEIGDRLWIIRYTARLMEKLRSVDLWEAYISKNKIFLGKEHAVVVQRVRELAGFIQKFVLTSHARNRISCQQLYEVLETNLRGDILPNFPWHSAPKMELYPISRTAHDNLYWKGLPEKVLECSKDVRVCRGWEKQNISPEFIYYAKALGDVYLSKTPFEKWDSNPSLTLAACILLAGEMHCCDIRRRDLMSLELLPSINYHDLEYSIKSRIHKIYGLIQGEMGSIVSIVSPELDAGGNTIGAVRTHY